MDVGPVVYIDVVDALRRSESQVVMAWLSGLSEASHGCLKES
jgi:cell division inhibitor SulA